MSIYVSLLTAGTNNHQETSENANAMATDFVSEGVIGTITNTSGVAPSTGAFAANAQATPDMTVKVSSGVAYVQGTPTSQNSQTFRVRMSADTNVTISSNTSGSTKYDWIYIKLDADKMANPAVAADDVATLVTSRSSSSTADNGTPPAYGYPLAVVTVANSASSITNASISDKRIPAKSVQDSAVTPEKRSGGFKMGIVPKATWGTTGSKSITGVGFKPKLVRFRIQIDTATFSSLQAGGYMDGNGSQYAYFTAAGAGGYTTLRSETECLTCASSNGGSTTKIFSVTYTSMDADGFTVNVGTALSAYDIIYEAWA